MTVNGWGVWGERQNGMDVADYSTHEREKSFILMSEFFASFVTGSAGIPVENRGIRWIVFLVAPPPPPLQPRYGNDPEH